MFGRVMLVEGTGALCPRSVLGGYLAVIVAPSNSCACQTGPTGMPGSWSWHWLGVAASLPRFRAVPDRPAGTRTGVTRRRNGEG